MIYLDSAATTPLSPAAFEKMKPYFSEEYGNPGAVYPFGVRAKQAVETARAQVAGFLGCEPDHVIFTSGATESNNLVFAGLERHLAEAGRRHILVSAVEHHSVLEAAARLRERGFEVQYIPVSSSGQVTAETVSRLLRSDTGLVSVMLVNNETGIVNEVADIGPVCHERGALLHTDLVQAARSYILDIPYLYCDFASISAHKLFGPKGVGALYAADKTLLSPLIPGGEAQEFGLRGGTENVPGIVGFGAACEELSRNAPDNLLQAEACKQKFYLTLQELLGGGLKVHGFPAGTGKILNIAIPGVDAESLVLMLGERGVCVSAGAACNGHSSEPSHVLLAMGVSDEEARSSVRVSFSPRNTQQEAVEAARIFAECVDLLRRLPHEE